MKHTAPDAAVTAAPARDPRRWWILGALCLTTLILIVDNMALSVAVPALAGDLHASAQQIQWILDSYMLVFAGLLLTSGSLSDRFGRKRIMVIGLTLFGAASLVATIAADPAELIAARVVMGAGGALIMPAALSIMLNLFDAEERHQAMSAAGAVGMLGLIGSPVLGGVLIDQFWWGAVFLINIPIVIIALVATLTLVPESRGPWRRPDPIGAIASVVGMVALIWTIIELPRGGLHHGSTVAALVIAIVSLIAFLVWESRIDHPMVPLRLFRDRDFAGGSIALTLVQIGNGGLLLVLTQYLQFGLGYSPLKAGIAFLPMAFAALVGNAAGAGLGSKVGPRMLAVVGMLVMAGGALMLAGLTADSGIGMISLALVVLGVGGGMASPAAVTAILGAVPPEQAGVGSALNDTIQQAGAALGVAVLGSILTTAYGHKMPDSASATARKSIGDALAEAAHGGDSGLVHTAREAFAGAMSVTFGISALGVLAAAILALLTLRGTRPGQVSAPYQGDISAADHSESRNDVSDSDVSDSSVRVATATVAVE
ncbi:DHA2 family efflux MFS transporter permease subunit [Nocardia yunnanensis]|uniref:DHA2 family efflux MFS transporter permease subunit n=1 Tax=Nocardia yunnanensis TaxID=2382165 RepID=A0A386Z4V4_9NOCA|nr:MFS transporter [Nocardia yunnanensis]AYF72818.1 DHA2 family efflux MFS transporter permease subunit [Nocardia yunnanensis]